MELRKKLLAVASLAFAAALSAGVAVSAGAEQTLDGFKIDGSSVRTENFKDADGNEVENSGGLRFHTVTPDEKTAYTEAYTVLTVDGIEGEKKVNTQEWRTPTAEDNTNGWNTVLMRIPEEYYTAEVTAQSFVKKGEIVYQTGVATTSIAQTASWAMNLGNDHQKLRDYTAGAVEKITLSQASATAFVGDADIQLTAETQPAGYGVVWATDDASVATVDNTGKVTIVGKGAAKITASMGGKVATFALTVYEKHEIDTVDEFMGMPTGDEFAYVTLTQDIDFTGTLIQFNATTSGTTYAPIGTGSSKFSGILDGNGYAIKNVNIIGNGGAAMFGCVFAYVDGTIKNLAADVTLTAVTKSAKDVGFIYYLYAGASVENCYVKFNTNATQYGKGNGHAVAAIATVANANGGVATVKNTVAVLDLTNLNSAYDGGFGGAASIIGGNSADTSTADIINCYGVTLTAASDTKNTAKLDSNDTTSVGGVYNPGVINKDTSAAFSSMYDMYVAAKTGMTTANGWNSFWSVANGALKFGDETIFEVYEISTAAEFMAMPTGDPTAYCVLTQDIDFAGTLIQYNATPAGTTYAPIGTAASKFSGILDGKGYAIKNVNIIGNGGAAMFGCVFAYVDGTIKNLAADVTLTATGKNAKDVGFIYNLYAGASVENCYVKFNTNATQYGNGNGRAVAAIATVANANGGVATVKNTVAVLDLTNLNSAYDGGFGGAASIIGGNSADTSTADIINCYGVTLTAAGDTKNTAKLDSNDTTSVNGAYNPGVINKDTSAAFSSMYDMYVAAKTGMTAANGWNSFWTVDAENNTLKFGQTVVYQPQAE